MRSDAERNRSKILAAANDLFATRAAAELTMDDIAKAAGVGRGTLYRRFPDRASIAAALLEEHLVELQEQLIRGAPPLGPGAPPAERLAAFFAAMVDLLDRHVHLALATDVGAARYEYGEYGFWRAHVRALVVATGWPDPDGVVDLLLAPVAPDVFRYQRDVRRISPDRIADNLAEISFRILGTDSVRRTL